MYNCKSLAFAAGLLLICNSLAAQKTDAVINEYAINYPNERIYVHFDNSLYVPGDTVWYKVYTMAGFLPTSFSKNVYIDWSDQSGKVLAHQLLALENATAAAQFVIPENFTGNALFTTAYTKWMLNGDPDFLFRRQLSVVTGTPPKPEERQAIKTSLNFFPEGGYGVSGLGSRLALKATDQWGNPAEVRGIIKDDQQKTIDSFATTHNGMGQLEITAQPGVKYTAEWIAADGKIQRTALPAFKQDGILLKVDNVPGHKKVRISTLPGKQQLYKDYRLLVTMQQRVVYMTTLQFKDNHPFVEINIPVSELPSGIMVVSLLAANWQPVAERISFVYDRNSVLYPGMKIIRRQPEARALNELELLYHDTFPASMSVSVTDAALADTTATDNNIVSSLLLSEELKGRIYDPAYYFSDSSEEIKSNMDLVMLTNGWRNYNWQKIVQRTKPVFQYAPDTTYMVFSGQIRNVPFRIMRKDVGLISFSFKDAKPVERKDLLFKKDGSFTDSSLIIFDTAKLTYRFPMDKTGLVTSDILFFRDKVPAPLSVTPWQQRMPGSKVLPGITVPGYDSLVKQLTILPNVVVKSKAQPALSTADELEQLYAGDLAKNAPGYKYDIENDPGTTGHTNIMNYLLGRVPGLISGRNGPQFMRVSRLNTGEISYFLNDMVTDFENISTIHPSDIAFVKAIPGYYVGAPNGGSSGSILIYTKKDYVAGKMRRKEILVEGYTVTRQFYQPDYSQTTSPAPDNRRTLYWNPNLTRDAASKAYKFAFYNNDHSRRLKVIIEGVNTDGKLIRSEKLIE
ncbi:hypothetical protein [Sediminibacterium ginsengisoli]|uniref:TonB-dependent Receptor Plug Domain n=1 Tax=Sediminibacterium ginsengisoli TaxID=413434 RepID=A0A1T4JQR7_9BACT|nr:hypothetical protein [Sediminibacterium ginsengisoli]SJZ32516.1 hypothetical protein SAMN04488132_10192 [Sediminibacterium ginsengisoli]